MASAVNGLMTYSWAPAASAFTIWVCSLSEVTIMIVTCRQAGLERTAETNCSPSITGMFQSTQARSGTQPPSRTSRPSRPWPACCTSYPRPSRAALTIRRMARESSITSARTSVPLQRAVGGAAADDDPLPGVVDAEGGFSSAEEEPTVGPHEGADPAEDRLLGRQVEVDEDVAQVDHVERTHPRQRGGQVALARGHHAPQRRVDLPLGARPGEVPDEHRRRQPAVDLELAELPGPRPLDHLAGEVGRGDGDPARGVGQRVLEEHRDRVRLLPAGAGRRPDLQPLGRAAGRQQGGQHRRGEGGERVAVPEPRRLVRGQRLDDPAGRLRAGPGADRVDQLADVGQAHGAGDGQQPRLHQVLLARSEHDRALPVHQLAHPVEARRSEGHRRPPAGAVAAARAGETVGPVMRRVIASATRSSGSTSSAKPAVATAPGLPHTTEVAWSWTTTAPPASRMRPAPRRPSEPMPVSTTPRTAPSKVSTAERNSGSTAGRQKFSGGAWSRAVNRPRPFLRIRRWWSPGARCTVPGASGVPSTASTTVSGQSRSSRWANWRGDTRRARWHGRARARPVVTGRPVSALIFGVSCSRTLSIDWATLPTLAGLVT